MLMIGSYMPKKRLEQLLKYQLVSLHSEVELGYQHQIITGLSAGGSF